MRNLVVSSHLRDEAQQRRRPAATDAVGTAYTFFATTPFKLDNGIESATANNVLKIGTTATIGSGVIRVIGVVAGDEI